MRIRLICCDVFLRPVSAFIAASPNIIDVEYVPMLGHGKPHELRADLQSRIDAAVRQRPYDLYILLYGLCGNSTVGLTCPAKLIMPRIHDCCTMFMGSKENFLAEFGGKLSMRWCSCGYYERCYLEGEYDSYSANNRTTYPEYQELVEKYGEENAEYVWDTMHPEIETPEAAYIELEGFEINGYKEKFAEQVKQQGKDLRLLKGGLAYLFDMINGPWDDARFLTVLPGQKITAVYDMERVVSASF